MAVLSIENFSFSYQLTKSYALKDINLSFEEGKSYGVSGLNGSGKTTLLNALRGFIPSYFPGDLKGEIKLFEKPLTEYNFGDLALHMGYVFQNPFNQITGSRETVLEEIAFGLENFGVAKDEMLERVQNIMEQTNTAYLAQKNPLDLSGGQQQRVALASVLVMNPSILIIDEPTSQLDPFETERVFTILDELKAQGKTIILVEHKMDLLCEFVDELIILKDGEVLCAGDKKSIFEDENFDDLKAFMPSSSQLLRELNKGGVQLKNSPLEFELLASEIESLWM